MYNPILNAKPLPKKLEEDLNNVGRIYKNTSQGSLSSQDDGGGLSSNSQKRGSGSSSIISRALDYSAERAMYDDILFNARLPVGSGYEATKRSHTNKAMVPTTAATPSNNTGAILAPSSNPTTATTSSSNNNTDFTTSILSRLKIVEAEAKEHRQQLATQIMKNQQLEEQLVSLQAATEDSDALLDEIMELKKTNAALKAQITEMEEFLLDYGLEWVGHSQSTAAQSASNASSIEHSNQHVLSFTQFAKCIRELNEIIYSEPTQIVRPTERMARLAHASEVRPHIRLVYYRNGLMIKRGPFRPCSGESYHSFMNDVKDGYFPSEMREEYPDGVVFDLIDCQHEVYSNASTAVGTKANTDSLSTAQFLQQMKANNNNKPRKHVLSNGEIVDVHEEIEQRLTALHAQQAGRTSMSVNTQHEDSEGHVKLTLLGEREAEASPARPQTSAERMQELFAHKHVDPLASNYGKQIVISTDANRHPDQQKLGSIVKIQIKWIDHTTLLCDMFEMNTIRELREEIRRHFQNEKNHKFVSATNEDEVELRTVYPSRALPNAITLMEAGLVPNGTLHARLKQ